MSNLDVPNIGGLVHDGEGHHLVVTDRRTGGLILRPLQNNREQVVDDPDALTVLARRGDVGGHPDGEGRR